MSEGMGSGFGGAFGSAGTCAIHVGTTATGTCERCGNYMCMQCTEGGRFTTCPSCRERIGQADFPLSRERYDFGTVFSLAWSTFQSHAMALSLASAIMFGISFVFGLCSNVVQQGLAGASGDAAAVGVISIGFSVVQNIVQGIFTLGLIHMSFRALSGQAPEVGEVFSQISRLGAWIAQVLVVVVPMLIVIGVVCGIPAGIGFAADEPEAGLIVAGVLGVLLMIPLIFVGLGLTFGAYELIYDSSVGPVEALRRSWAMASGHRASIFGIAFVAGLIMLGGLLVCCVGVIPAQAFYFVLMATLHRTLRNGSGIAEPPARF